MEQNLQEPIRMVRGYVINYLIQKLIQFLALPYQNVHIIYINKNITHILPKTFVIKCQSM